MARLHEHQGKAVLRDHGLHVPRGCVVRTPGEAAAAAEEIGPQVILKAQAWITGRKRFQNGQRSALDFFEPEAPSRLRVNPLAHWRPEDVQDYMIENNLPRHPLVSKGYPSIGCAPCTSPVGPGEDPRAGRWRGRDKSECGIHFIGGRMVRGKVSA